MVQYLLVTLSALLIAVNSASSKRYSDVQGSGTSSGMMFNLLTGVIATVFFLALTGFTPAFSWFSLICALLSALATLLYLVLGFRVINAGGVTTYTLFLMAGGMVLPYIYGVLFLDEPLTAFRIVGILLILAALFLVNPSSAKLKPSFYAVCVVVFALNGFVSIMSKFHQAATDFPIVDSTDFAVYQSIGRVVMGALLLWLLPGREKPLKLPSLSISWTVLLSAVSFAVSFLLILITAVNLPASVLFPFITGGSVIFSSLLGAVFFKEKLTLPRLAAIGLCFAGTLLFL